MISRLRQLKYLLPAMRLTGYPSLYSQDSGGYSCPVIRYNGVIYNNVTDVLLNDLQDDEILHIWKQLKDKIRAVSGKGSGVA